MSKDNTRLYHEALTAMTRFLRQFYEPGHNQKYANEWTKSAAYSLVATALIEAKQPSDTPTGNNDTPSSRANPPICQQ